MALSNFFNIAVCAEITALGVALITLLGRATTFWGLFILFLAITIITEATGFYLTADLKWKDNAIIYNAFMLIQMGFYSFLFIQFLEARKIRLYILLGFALMIIYFILEAWSNSSVSGLFKTYQASSRLILSIFVVLFSCLFFFLVLRNDSLKNPLAYPPFWIITGLFFYYFGSIVMFAFREEVRNLRLSGNSVVYELITGSLSIILYGCWIIGFLWVKKQIQSSRE